MIYGNSFACAWSLKTEKCILAQQTFFISWRQLKNSPHSKMALLWDHSLERNFKGWKNMVVFRVGKRWGQKLIVFKISLIKHCIIIQHKREWHKKMPFNFSHLKALIECLKDYGHFVRNFRVLLFFKPTCCIYFYQTHIIYNGCSICVFIPKNLDCMHILIFNTTSIIKSCIVNTLAPIKIPA